MTDTTTEQLALRQAVNNSIVETNDYRACAQDLEKALFAVLETNPRMFVPDSVGKFVDGWEAYLHKPDELDELLDSFVSKRCEPFSFEHDVREASGLPYHERYSLPIDRVLEHIREKCEG